MNDDENNNNDYVLDSKVYLSRPKIKNFRKNAPTCMKSKIVTIETPIEKLPDRQYTSSSNHSSLNDILGGSNQGRSNLARNKTYIPQRPVNTGPSFRMPGLGEITDMKAQLRAHKSINSPIKIHTQSNAGPVNKSPFPQTKKVSIDINDSSPSKLNHTEGRSPRITNFSSNQPLSTSKTFNSKDANTSLVVGKDRGTYSATKNASYDITQATKPSSPFSNRQDPTSIARGTSTIGNLTSSNISGKIDIKSTKEPLQKASTFKYLAKHTNQPNSNVSNVVNSSAVKTTTIPAVNPTKITSDVKKFGSNKPICKNETSTLPNSSSEKYSLNNENISKNSYQKYTKSDNKPNSSKPVESSHDFHKKLYRHTTTVTASTGLVSKEKTAQNISAKIKNDHTVSDNIAKNIGILVGKKEGVNLVLEFFEKTSEKLLEESIHEVLNVEERVAEFERVGATRQKTMDEFLTKREKLEITARYSPNVSPTSIRSPMRDPIHKVRLEAKRRSTSTDLDLYCPGDKVRQALAIFAEYGKKTDSNNLKRSKMSPIARARRDNLARTYMAGSPVSVKSIASVYIQNAQQNKALPHKCEHQGKENPRSSNKANVTSLVKNFDKNF